MKYLIQIAVVVMVMCGSAFGQENSPLLIYENGKYGYINSNAEVVIKPQYDWAMDFSYGRAIVRLEYDEHQSVYGIINEKGEIVFKISKGRPFLYYLDSILKVEYHDYKNSDINFIYYDRMGKIIENINPNIFRHDDNLRPIGVNGLFGYADSSNQFYIKPQFKYANKFSEGLAAVSPDGKLYGYIDTTGSFVIEPKFASADEFSEGLAFVTISRNNVMIFGATNAVINKKGGIVINANSVLNSYNNADGKSGSREFMFFGASKFKNGVAQFYEGVDFSGRIRYIDKEGKLIW